MSETFKYPRLILALCLGGLLALTGCPDDNGENGGDDLCEGVTCPASQTCDPATGECVDDEPECEVDADCNDPTLECRGEQCISKCQGIPCPDGEICEPTTGICIIEPCAADSDCKDENDEVCVEGECRATQFGDCSEVDCTDDLECLTLQLDGGGTANSCYEPCTSASDCSDLTLHCADVQNQGDYCRQNLCGTSPVFDANGWTTTTWSGPCDVEGQDDGTCFGPLINWGTAQQPLLVGLCVADGQAAPGATCDINAGLGDALACDGGICNPVSEGAVQGICLGFCTLLDGQECADVGGQPQACTLVQGRGGVCWNQSDPAIASGETCDDGPEQLELECVEDHTCDVLSEGTPATCIAYCDQLSPSCPDGEECVGFYRDNTLLGICAPTT